MYYGGPPTNPADMVRALYADPRTRVIDVREPGEVAGGALARAVNIPHASIGAAGAYLPPDRTTPIIVYCAAGGRAQAALQVLQSMGYTNVINAGGYASLRHLDGR